MQRTFSAFDRNCTFDHNYAFDRNYTFDRNCTFDRNYSFGRNHTFDRNCTFDHDCTFSALYRNWFINMVNNHHVSWLLEASEIIASRAGNIQGNPCVSYIFGDKFRCHLS